MNDATIIWAVLLITIGLVLFFLELFLPTGGILGILAAALLIGGVVMLFYADTTLGLIGTIASLVALPFLMVLGLKLLPNTPIFRRLTLTERQKRLASRSNDACSATAALAVNDSGKTLTELRPVGTCLIGGHRVECLAEHGVIPQGTSVRVMSVDGMHIKVRAIEN